VVICDCHGGRHPGIEADTDRIGAVAVGACSAVAQRLPALEAALAGARSTVASPIA
jgi:hypothetical protein